MLQLADTFSVSLSVRENLAYGAALRLGTTLGAARQLERVELVIALLHLERIADVVVGAATGGGISGGQKRKLALGVEMLVLGRDGTQRAVSRCKGEAREGRSRRHRRRCWRRH